MLETLLAEQSDEKFLREIGKNLYAWSFAHTVRVDRQDNLWAVDKGSDMIVKFNQAGRVLWVFGRRKESAEEETKPWEHVNPPLPAEVLRLSINCGSRLIDVTSVGGSNDGNFFRPAGNKWAYNLDLQASSIPLGEVCALNVWGNVGALVQGFIQRVP